MGQSFSAIALNVLKYGGLASLLVTLLTLGLLYSYQTSIIYPSSFPKGSRTNVPLPSTYNLKYERLSLKTRDKQTLDSFLMLQEHDPESRPTLLYFHANAGNMGHRLPIARVFYTALNMNVFIISYRGYGKSTGVASENGLQIDAQTALDFLKDHPVCSKTKIVVYGQSIGGAVGIALTAKNQDSVSALLLENTFLSIPDMIPTVIPFGAPVLSRFCTQRWPSKTRIKKIDKVPVLFLSAESDELVPPSHMKLLFAASKSPKKQFRSFRNVHHNDTCLAQGYFQVIADFLQTNDVLKLTA
ncbi:esterase/lipase [Schizosaccharomyces japonicus yFS275]|uniref:Esterase/lipase n=1 Tax=Schizosaccharomyces japonicus (strain yFS275 / FY16936) TaxID=402676 RepID=B6JWJ8_SCHJY|nr:esterase/lipase [Schizosaccharomyces japonicus yFS275]EEB05749.1 esterase/lipase [Schizosaccharomyces japonicus yFS275]